MSEFSFLDVSLGRRRIVLPEDYQKQVAVEEAKLEIITKTKEQQEVDYTSIVGLGAEAIQELFDFMASGELEIEQQTEAIEGMTGLVDASMSNLNTASTTLNMVTSLVENKASVVNSTPRTITNEEGEEIANPAYESAVADYQAAVEEQIKAKEELELRQRELDEAKEAQKIAMETLQVSRAKQDELKAKLEEQEEKVAAETRMAQDAIAETNSQIESENEVISDLRRQAQEAVEASKPEEIKAQERLARGEGNMVDLDNYLSSTMPEGASEIVKDLLAEQGITDIDDASITTAGDGSITVTTSKGDSTTITPGQISLSSTKKFAGYDEWLSEKKAAGLKATHIGKNETDFGAYMGALDDGVKSQILDAFDETKHSPEEIARNLELQQKVAGLFTSRNYLNTNEFIKACKAMGLQVNRTTVKTDYIPDWKAGNFGGNVRKGSITMLEIIDPKTGASFKIVDSNGNGAIEMEEVFGNELLKGVSSMIDSNQFGKVGNILSDMGIIGKNSRKLSSKSKEELKETIEKLRMSDSGKIKVDDKEYRALLYKTANMTASKEKIQIDEAKEKAKELLDKTFTVSPMSNEDNITISQLFEYVKAL